MSSNPLSALGPLAQAILEVLKLPMSVMEQPDIQNQVKELPEIIRLNANYFVQNIREGPRNLQDLAKSIPTTKPEQKKEIDPLSAFMESLTKK